MNTYTKNIFDSYYAILFCLLFIVLPYSIAVSNIVVISISLLWLIDLFITKKIKLPETHYYFSFPFILLFLSYALSVIYSSDKSEALSILERRIPVLLLPLLIFTVPFKKKDIHTILYYFTLSILLCCFVALALTAIYFVNNPTDYYLEKALWYMPQTIKFHAPYLALYLVTSNIICFYFYTHRDKRVAVSIVFLFNNIFLLLISSRSALLANWLFIIALSSYYLFISKGKLITILNILAICGVLALAYIHIPYLHTKVSKITEAGYGAGQRVVSAKAALEVIQDNPLIGVGIGDVQSELVTKLPDSTYADFNVHNQYLNELMTCGLIGFAFFAFTLVVGYHVAIVNRDMALVLFLCAIIISFLTEVILSRYHGIMLFSTVFPLLIRLNLSEGVQKLKYSARLHFNGN